MPGKRAVPKLEEQALFTYARILFVDVKDLAKNSENSFEGHCSAMYKISQYVEYLKQLLYYYNICNIVNYHITRRVLNKLGHLCFNLVMTPFEYSDELYDRLVLKIAKLLFIPSNMRSISFLSNFPGTVNTILFHKLSLMCELRTLQIKFSHIFYILDDSLLEVIMEALVKMPHLQEFTFDICTDKIMECIAANCTVIEKIDVSSSRKVTNACIPALCMCNHLKIFIFSGTAITRRGYETLLIEHPCLEFANFQFLTVISYVTAEETNSEEPNRICNSDKTLNIDYLRKLNIMNITRIYISLNIENQLRILFVFPNVRQIKIHIYRCEQHCNYLYYVLKVSGSKITTLFFEEGTIDLSTLFIIRLFCPNIRNLIFHKIDNIADVMPKKELCLNTFIPILSLKIQIDIMSVETVLTKYFMKALLSHSINIQTIVIEGFEFDDGTIREIISLNPMKQLEILWITGRKFLTMRSVNLLMETCDNLCYLQDLEHWNIDKKQLHTLKRDLRINNTNLIIDNYGKTRDIRVIQKKQNIYKLQSHIHGKPAE